MLSSTPAEATPRRDAFEDLAICGGRPAFAEPRHVGRPNVGDRARLLERLDDLLDRRWLTNDGPYVKEFEQRIGELAEAEHCIAVSSGTMGLQLAARALGVSGQVIVPSFTFVATVHALTWIGLEPVFCDVDPRTHTMDPADLSRAMTPNTGGIVGVHVWGHPCDIERVSEFARAHELPLVFDAAHALGCSYRGRAVGSFGNAEVFSFHATKVVNAGEGGAITTNDGDLARRLRLMRNFGFAEYDTVIELGTNAKMSELAAAMGLSSLDSVDEFLATNRRNYFRYRDELDGVPGISLMEYDETERHNYHYVVVEVADGAAAELRRDDLIAVLHAENVLARRYFHPGCHRLDAYRDHDGVPVTGLPATEHLASRVLVLPTGTAIDESDVATICSIVRVAAENVGDVRRRVADPAVRV
jgi:dTDP-4-amino-4,6-dideoxygalactose transaminase